MSITWRDGITTLSTAGVIVLERAYFHNWDWPLVSSLRWMIVGLAVLTAVGLIFSYTLDKFRSSGWSLVAGTLGTLAAGFTGLGLIFNDSDYLVLLMLTAVVFWLASIVRHITIPSTLSQSHA